MTAVSAPVLSVLLVEGPTEKHFYTRVKDRYLKGHCSCIIQVVEGLFNINDKVLHALKTKNTDRLVRAYCCLDRESRYSKTPGFDIDFIRADLKKENISNVLSVDKIIATQMIESWFFYDIAGIYKYLKVPRAQRNMKAYVPVEGFRVSHLKELFRRHKKVYSEGDRAKHFIESLDLESIVSQCSDLRDGVQSILTNG